MKKAIIQEFNLPKAIIIYDEDTKGINFGQFKKFIQDNFGKIEVIAKKVKNLVAREGLLFNFLGTQKNFQEIVAKDKQDPIYCHIIITQDLIATFDEYKKLHLRVCIHSYPSVISLAGIVEGPAKPREYYLYRQRYEKLGLWPVKESELKNKFKGEFIDYEDKRTTEVLKGYIAQSIFFHLTGNPFCLKKECRLFNSHWQKDLIYSQIKSAKFCSLHKKILSKIKNYGR